MCIEELDHSNTGQTVTILTQDILSGYRHWHKGSISGNRYHWRHVTIHWILYSTSQHGWWHVTTITLCGDHSGYDHGRCRNLCLIHSKDQTLAINHWYTSTTRQYTFPLPPVSCDLRGLKKSVFGSVGQPKHISVIDVLKHKTEEIPRCNTTVHFPKCQKHLFSTFQTPWKGPYFLEISVEKTKFLKFRGPFLGISVQRTYQGTTVVDRVIYTQFQTSVVPMGTWATRIKVLSWQWWRDTHEYILVF